MRLPFRRQPTNKVRCQCGHLHETDDLAFIGPYLVCRHNGCYERVLMASRVGTQTSLWETRR